MKVAPVKLGLSYNTATKKPADTVRYENKTTGSNNLNNLPHYKMFSYNNISFGNKQKTPLNSDDYKNAKQYFEAQSKHYGSKELQLSDFDLDKLNGIQYGIEVFDGLNMKEIGYLMANSILLLNRGCNNMCSHCMYDARPNSKSTNAIDAISFEDLNGFLDGISRLSANLDDKIDFSYSLQPILFLDSDCIDINIQDKDGKSYDYIDCAELIKSHLSNFSTYFDTAGWNPASNSSKQKTAQKLVEYLKQTKGQGAIGGVNVSINTFHPLYTINREKYVERMANVLLCFAPLLDVEGVEYHLLFRNKKPDGSDTDNIHGSAQTDKLREDIFNKLGELLEQSEDETVRSAKKRYLQKYKEKFRESKNIEIFKAGRARQLFKNTTLHPNVSKDALNMRSMLSSSEAVINPNGEVVLLRAEEGWSNKTDIKLNFKNKDKAVPAVAYELEDYTFSLPDDFSIKKMREYQNDEMLANMFGFSDGQKMMDFLLSDFGDFL